MTEEIKETEAPAPEAAAEPAAESAPVSASAGDQPAVEAPVSETATRAPERRPYADRQPYGDRNQGGDKPQRMPRFKRKVCRFCFEKDAKIDYKVVDTLERFITDRGKILPRRVTGTCSKHQREIAQAIKRARIIAILPFMES